MSSGLTLGVLSPFLGGWYYGGVLSGIVHAAAEAGAKIIAIQTLDAGNDMIEVTDPPDLGYPIAWQHVSGFIVIINAVSPPYLSSLKSAGRPVVLISHEIGGIDWPVVMPDNRTGVAEAVEHLIEHGHRRIAFAGYLGAKDVRERYEAYRETLLINGLEPDPELLFSCDNNQYAGGDLAAQKMIAAGMPSTAVVAATDSNALGIMRTLGSAGYQLPQDQAIIGFDDRDVAAYATPRLSSVRHPVEAIGSKAAAELMACIRDGACTPEHHYVPTSLVVRESCGCAENAPADVPDTPDASLRVWLTTRLAAIISPGQEESTMDDPVVTHAVDLIARTIQPVAGEAGQPSAAELRQAFDALYRLAGRPDCLTAIARLLRAVGREAASWNMLDYTPAAPIRIAQAVQSLIFALMRTHGRAYFSDSAALQETLTMQYEVSMELLRSHVEDPRQLGWLARTSTRAGCLGLWAIGRSTDSNDLPLDVVGVFVRDQPPARPREETVPVSRFPPTEVLEFAATEPGLAVFVVPVKISMSDWGLLAIVDSVETRVATGRETINQWAALLTVALDHQAVLRELQKQEDQLRAAALYDHLTSLPNRSLFLDRLRQAIRRAKRRPDHRFAVLFLDLDGFKVVNDSMGHAAGDRLLVQVAERINATLRESDTAARFGGDEFLILLDPIDAKHTPSKVAERLHEALAEPFQLLGQNVVVTASIGIAISGSRYENPEDLLRDADIAMYWAKSHRRGSHAIFDVAMHERAVSRLRIETELRQAIEHNEFEVFYQPIVHLRTGETRAFEALVRWRHPIRGLVAPAEFLPIAEETGLITSIGRWVMAEACRKLAHWQQTRGRPHLRIAVNVSNREFWTGSLIDDVAHSLSQAGLNPGSLAIEITEGVIMENLEEARKVLKGLHDLGCELHIDDFGTGYSSLEALHRLAIDALKIDRSFVSRLGADPKSSELVQTIILMGRNLGLNLIAEGIETTAQRDRLLQLGCSSGQGYLFSPAVPATLAETLIITRWPSDRLLFSPGRPRPISPGRPPEMERPDS